MRFEGLVNVVAAEAVRGFAEGVAEETADAEIPGFDPGEYTVGGIELLLELIDVLLDVFLVDDPSPGLGIENEEVHDNWTLW
jgi:hypothetical protein